MNLLFEGGRDNGREREKERKVREIEEKRDRKKKKTVCRYEPSRSLAIYQIATLSRNHSVLIIRPRFVLLNYFFVMMNILRKLLIHLLPG